MSGPPARRDRTRRCRRRRPALSSHPICLLSGLRATDDCPSVGPEWLRDGRLPARCTWHRDGRRRGRAVRLALALPRLGDARRACSTSAPRRRCAAPHPRRAGDRRAALRIVSPPPGATYLRDPTLRAEFQTLPLRAETAAAAPLDLGGRRADRSAPPRPRRALAWPLRPGAHVVGGDGRRAAAAPKRRSWSSSRRVRLTRRPVRSAE